MHTHPTTPTHQVKQPNSIHQPASQFIPTSCMLQDIEVTGGKQSTMLRPAAAPCRCLYAPVGFMHTTGPGHLICRCRAAKLEAWPGLQPTNLCSESVTHKIFHLHALRHPATSCCRQAGRPCDAGRAPAYRSSQLAPTRAAAAET